MVKAGWWVGDSMVAETGSQHLLVLQQTRKQKDNWQQRHKNIILKEVYSSYKPNMQDANNRIHLLSINFPIKSITDEPKHPRC